MIVISYSFSFYFFLGGGGEVLFVETLSLAHIIMKHKLKTARGDSPLEISLGNNKFSFKSCY